MPVQKAPRRLTVQAEDNLLGMEPYVDVVET